MAGEAVERLRKIIRRESLLMETYSRQDQGDFFLMCQIDHCAKLLGVMSRLIPLLPEGKFLEAFISPRYWGEDSEIAHVLLEIAEDMR